MAKATAFRVVRRISYALFCRAKHFIHWPKTPQAAERVAETFKAMKGFPGVIGAVNGSHIPIRAPVEDPVSYINRKGFHSIVLQAVCDGNCMFTHCYCGPVGSVHDARVLAQSPLRQLLRSPHTYFPNNTHIIGDAAYTLQTHVMVPFRDNGHLTRRQQNFNFRLSSTRMVIERAFGLMKVSFRILLDCLPLTDIRKIPEFVVACCVLHNICMTQNDFFPYEVPEVPAEDGVPEAGRVESGINKRERIMYELPFRVGRC